MISGLRLYKNEYGIQKIAMVHNALCECIMVLIITVALHERDHKLMFI